MSNKLIADLMSFRSRMVADARTQVMFEGDFDTIDQTIAELKRLEASAKLWGQLTAHSTNISAELRQQLEAFAKAKLTTSQPFGWLLTEGVKVSFYCNKHPEATFSEGFISKYKDNLTAVYTTPQEAISPAESYIERLEAALSYYAGKERYTSSWDTNSDHVMEDKGQLARNALERLN